MKGLILFDFEASGFAGDPEQLAIAKARMGFIEDIPAKYMKFGVRDSSQGILIEIDPDTGLLKDQTISHGGASTAKEDIVYNADEADDDSTPTSSTIPYVGTKVDTGECKTDPNPFGLGSSQAITGDFAHKELDSKLLLDDILKIFQGGPHGGHTERHIAKPDEFLIKRGGKLGDASSFYDERTARQAISDAINEPHNKQRIVDWFNDLASRCRDGKIEIKLSNPSGKPLGTGIKRGETSPTPRSNVFVRLVKVGNIIRPNTAYLED